MENYRYIESEDLYDMACQWIKYKNFEKAEECLNKVIALNPRFIYAYISLASIHARNKNFHEAIHILKKASKMDPSFDKIYYLMTKYAYKNGDYKNALIYIDRALEINPSQLYIIVKDIIINKYK